MADITSKKLLEQIENLIEGHHIEELKQVLAEARSSDVAEVVEVLDEIERQILFDLLDPKDAGEVLEKIDEATRSEVVEDFSSDKLTDIVATLPPDEAADVFAEMSDTQAGEILGLIDKEESDQIEKLLVYDEDTAGGIMTPEVVKVLLDVTIGDALAEIREADPDEDFFYVFVVDESGVLQGMVGIWELIRNLPSRPVREVMDTEFYPVKVGADQEAIANFFRKNDLLVAPVVDAQGVLLGRITVDDVVDVMEEEAEEDVLVMAGTHPDELDTTSIFKAASVRLPWLLSCMLSSLVLAALFIRLFAGMFDMVDWACIIMFLPCIASMGGNSGLQTSTVVVRGLATGDLAAFDLSQVYLRESRVALVVAVVCALIAGCLATVWLEFWPAEMKGVPAFDSSHGPILGLAVGLAMLCSIMLSTSMGMVLPYFFLKIGVDPAISSGPLVTTANDVISYLAYFSLSLLLLHTLGG